MSDLQASKAGKNRSVLSCVKSREGAMVVRGVAMLDKSLLAVQRLNSSCTDDASLPLSLEETRLYVQICKRLTKLLFHAC